jgi:hypothetical protein
MQNIFHNQSKIKFMRILLVFAFALIFNLTHAQSLLSGFSLKHKEKVIAIGGGLDIAKEYFTQNRAVALKRNIEVIGIYGAYGLKNEWNLIATYTFIDFTPQDIKFGVSKAVLHANKIHMVTGAGLFAPTSDYLTEGLFAAGQQARGIWIEHVIQYRHAKYHLDLALGANIVDAPTPTNFPVSLTFGKSYAKSYLKLFTSYQHGLGNKFYRGVGEEAPTTFKELGVTYLKVGGQFIYTKSSWLPYIGLSRTLYGKNAFKATSVSVGVIKKF